MDTSKIEGYAEMTAEQKLAALEAYEPEIPTESPEVEKLKRTLICSSIFLRCSFASASALWP